MIDIKRYKLDIGNKFVTFYVNTKGEFFEVLNGLSDYSDYRVRVVAPSSIKSVITTVSIPRNTIIQYEESENTHIRVNVDEDNFYSVISGYVKLMVEKGEISESDAENLISLGVEVLENVCRS